jgi:hypothetical protein
MKSDLQTRLRELGYLELFQRMDERAVTALWKDPDALVRLALDGDADPLARFLAADIDLENDPSRFSEEDRHAIAHVYADALREQVTSSANEWSFPDGFAGRAGGHLIALGTAAVAALRPLLDDDKRVTYEGSQEGMFGRSYQFRIKDLAALFVSKILGHPFPDDKNPRVRDAAIATLKRTLS